MIKQFNRINLIIITGISGLLIPSRTTNQAVVSEALETGSSVGTPSGICRQYRQDIQPQEIL
jgi:hypothetical protein